MPFSNTDPPQGAPREFSEMMGRIYLMTESDIRSVVDIERMCFPVPWGYQSFLAEYNNPYSLNFVIKEPDSLENNHIYAYSCNHVVGNELSILKMAVSPEKRRLGYAEHLLGTVIHRAIQKGATEAFLEVRPSNYKAQALYRKLGFRVIGTRPNYYPETGEDALMMMKILKEIS